MRQLSQTLDTAVGVDVLWECDASLRYTSVAPQIEAVLGYGSGELIGQSLDEMVPPEEADAWRGSLGAALAGRLAFEGIVTICLHRDGRRVYLRSSGEPIFRDGGFQGFRGVYHDVTNLRRLMGDVRHFETLLDSSPNFIGLASLTGAALYLNDHGMRMVGISSKVELGALTINDFMLPEFVEHHMTVIYPALLRDGKWEGEHQFRHFETGEAIPLEAYSFVVRDPASGAPTAIAIIARDLRQEKKQQAERRKLEERLRQAQKMESLGRLAGGIAHDFNNLLTPILGNLDLALRARDVPAQLREQLKSAHNATHRMAALTQQVLAFGHKQVLSLKPSSLDDLVKDVADVLRQTIKPVSLELSLDAEGTSVEVDPGQMTQVLINLVVNARDALNGAGDVEVLTRAVTIGEDSKLPLATGAYGVLEVRDQGVGIEPDILSRVFEPFFSTKDRGRGTGLGLATVHGIVQQHGGRVEVCSTPGQGTTFSIFLPVSLREEPEREAPRRAQRTAGRGERLLLVEDDWSVRAFLAAMLRGEGYRVEVASDLAQARAILRGEGELDVMLCDVVLPDGRGPELLADRPALPVVFMSGYPDEAAEQLGTPGRHYLLKPFEPLALLSKLRLALTGR